MGMHTPEVLQALCFGTTTWEKDVHSTQGNSYCTKCKHLFVDYHGACLDCTTDSWED